MMDADKTESKVIKIYMAGKVAKGSETGSIKDWRPYYAGEISRVGNFNFISPENPETDESKPFEVFGYACHLIQECNLVFVDASTKLGAGTAQEMLIAKYLHKNVVTILPFNSHHRRANLQMHQKNIEDWIHPFIYSTSDYIFSETEQVVHFFKNLDDHLKSPAKCIAVIDQAISAYRKV